MRRRLRGGFVTIRILVLCLLLSRIAGEPVYAQQRMQRSSSGKSSGNLPFYRLLRVISVQDMGALPASLGRPSKIRFVPVKIVGTVVALPPARKETSRLARILPRPKPFPKEQITKGHTGIVLELDSGYGIYNTFIGRLQHGTQFKGAHYSMNGHWERTNGKQHNKKEENIAASLKVDWDISKSSILSLNSSYFQSQITLPQLPGAQRHKKSVIQLIADLQMNPNPETNAAITFSGEQASFSDQHGVQYDMRSYGGQLTLKRLWSRKNMLSLQVKGAWEEYFQDDDHLENRYYGTGTLLNSFALQELFSFDAGVTFDYYHSEDLAFTDYLISPIATMRLHLFGNATLYATYHPQFKIPRFTDLYLRQLYTSVNPALHAEKTRYYVEAGINQRFGDAFSLNIGYFYHESEDVLYQLDENLDHILEYDQLGSAHFMGIKANFQMNYREQFVQSVTYTYTMHDILSGEDVNSPGERFYRNSLPYQPNHQVQASVYWVTPIGLIIDLNGTYISEQFRNKEGNPIGKRFFVNVDLTQRISENIQVFLVGRNLTDTDTYDVIPLLDSEEITSSRLFIGGIRFRF